MTVKFKGYDVEELKAAHKGCTNNVQAIIKAEVASCFHCLNVFTPEYMDLSDTCDNGTTLICATCAVDAMLPGKWDQDFLEVMREYWFYTQLISIKE